MTRLLPTASAGMKRDRVDGGRRRRRRKRGEGEDEERKEEGDSEIKWLAWGKKGGRKTTKLGRSNEPLAFVNNSRGREE